LAGLFPIKRIKSLMIEERKEEPEKREERTRVFPEGWREDGPWHTVSRRLVKGGTKRGGGPVCLN